MIQTTLHQKECYKLRQWHESVVSPFMIPDHHFDDDLDER